MTKTPMVDERLEALLATILSLREGLAKLDELDLHEAASHVDLALAMLEPMHPDVVAGLHGPRPLPESLKPLQAQLDNEPE